MNRHFFISNFKQFSPFIYGLTLVLLVVLLVNFIVDTKGLYSTQEDRDAYYDNYINVLLSSNKPLPIPQNERYAKYTLGKKSNKEVYILGSSRSLKIDAALLNETKTVNLCVSGAGYEDFELFIGMLLNKEKLPRKIYVSIDPWFFHKNSDIRYLELFKLYQTSLRQLNMKETTSTAYLTKEKFKNLINRHYFISNITFLIDRFTKLDKNSKLKESFNPDGTINYSAQMELNADKIHSAQMNGFDYKLEHLEMDEEIVNKFKHIVSLCQSKKIKFTFICLPYHPRGWEGNFNFQSIIPKLNQFNSMLTKLSQELNIPLIGIVDPRPYGLQSEDYYDAIHLKKRGLKMVIQSAFNPSVRSTSSD